MKNRHEYQAEKQVEFHCQLCNGKTIHTMCTNNSDNAALEIQCIICEETQEYLPKKKKPQKADASKKKGAAGSKSKHKEKPESFDYKKLLAKHDTSAALQYETILSFKLDDIINHHFFGIGFVCGTIFPNKIEVLFSEGLKILICAPSPERISPTVSAISPTKKNAHFKPRSQNSWQSWSNYSEDKREPRLGWSEHESSD